MGQTVFSPRVQIIGQVQSKSYLEVIPILISNFGDTLIDPMIHMEEELFTITLSCPLEFDIQPQLTSLQKVITSYLDWQHIDYIVYEDYMAVLNPMSEAIYIT